MTATVTKTAMLNGTAIEEIGCMIKKENFPARTKRCRNSNKMGHFEAVGKTKRIKVVRTKTVAE